MRCVKSGIAALLLSLSFVVQADISAANGLLTKGDILSESELTARIQTTPEDVLGMNLIPHASGYIYQLWRRDQHGEVRTDFVDAYTGDSLSRLAVQQLLAGAKYYTF